MKDTPDTPTNKCTTTGKSLEQVHGAEFGGSTINALPQPLDEPGVYTLHVVAHYSRPFGLGAHLEVVSQTAKCYIGGPMRPSGREESLWCDFPQVSSTASSASQWAKPALHELR